MPASFSALPPGLPARADDVLAENLRLRAAAAAQADTITVLTSRLREAETARDAALRDLAQAQVEASVAEALIDTARQNWQQEFERDLARRRESARLEVSLKDAALRLAGQAGDAAADAETRTHLEREVTHRVMNEFAVLQAQLQADEQSAPSADAQQAFRSARGRVKAMAVLHDVLGQVEAREIENVPDWLAGVAAKFERALFRYTSQLKLEIVAPDARLPGRLAGTLAKCLAELLFNAAKYGAGEVLLRLELTAGRQWVLTARNHIGPPRSECFGTGSGMQLLGRLLEKAGGSISTEQDNGLFTARVLLPAA